MKKFIIQLSISSVMFLGLFFFNSCEKEEKLPIAKEVVINETISKSVSWFADSVYVIDGHVYVENNAVLTILPGTVIKFNAGASLSFGYSNNATIIANGTAEKPIVFTSNAALPTPGAWRGLIFYTNTLQNSVLNHCVIEYAGNSDYAALTLNNSEITITNSIIKKASNDGISAINYNNKGGFVSFVNNTLKDISGNAISIHSSKVHTIAKENTFENTGPVLLYGDFDSTSPRKWNNLEVPYLISETIAIDGDLTIEEGAQFHFDAGTYWYIGYNKTTKLTANGTAEAPIIFTSSASSPSAGAWRGFEFYSKTQNNSSLSYCIIDYAGKDYERAIQLYDARLNFTHNTLRNISGYGIKLNSGSGFTSFHNNNITSTDHVISISTQQLADLGVPNTFIAGTNKGIELFNSFSSNTAKTWRKQENVDFYIDESVSIDGNLTIEEGSVFKMGGSGYFYIGYNSNTSLKAIGTADNPIIFTSEMEDPAPASWRGFQFYSKSTINTEFKYCQFNYAGKENFSTLVAYGYSSLTINNCEINHHGGNEAPAYRQHDTTINGNVGNNFEWAYSE